MNRIRPNGRLAFVLSCALLLTQMHNSQAQLPATQKMLDKAKMFHGYNKVRGQKAQDIYNELLATDPTNALVYAESGFFNMTYADKKLGLVDLDVAIYLLENKKCDCDYTYADNTTEVPYYCSLALLEEIYGVKRRYYYEKEEWDSAQHYANKLIAFFTHATGLHIDSAKFSNRDHIQSELGFLYDFKMSVSAKQGKYKEALGNYHQLIQNDTNAIDKVKWMDLSMIVGNYDSVLQTMKQEFFRETDTGSVFIYIHGYSKARYFFNYLTAYMAKRDFGAANNLLAKNTQLLPVPGKKGVFQHVLLKDEAFYQEGESPNMCERYSRYDDDYNFFSFYTCMLHHLVNNQYESALQQIDRFQSQMSKSLPVLTETSFNIIMGRGHGFTYQFAALKGYLLMKMNRKEAAKAAYQEALKLNPHCQEALKEMKDLAATQ